jgi:hypothetical protein
VWHFVHGWPVVCAIFVFAIVGREVAAMIALTINIAASVPAARDKTTPIIFAIRIAELLAIASNGLFYLDCFP